jgi:hypothetical protein
LDYPTQTTGDVRDGDGHGRYCEEARSVRSGPLTFTAKLVTSLR